MSTATLEQLQAAANRNPQFAMPRLNAIGTAADSVAEAIWKLTCAQQQLSGTGAPEAQEIANVIGSIRLIAMRLDQRAAIEKEQAAPVGAAR